MPKNRVQEICFTVLNSGVMILLMGIYNVSLNLGGLSAASLDIAVRHFPLEWAIGFLLAFFLASKFAKQMSGKVTEADDRILLKILSIQTFTVCAMVPMMSLVGTLMNAEWNLNFIFIWIQTSILNFGMALLLQYFVVGPLCRKVFRLIFVNHQAAEKSAIEDGFAE